MRASALGALGRDRVLFALIQLERSGIHQQGTLGDPHHRRVGWRPPQRQVDECALGSRQPSIDSIARIAGFAGDEKLQSLVSQGAVTRAVTGVIKKYKGVGSRMVKVSAEMKLLRAEWNARLRAKAAAAA